MAKKKTAKKKTTKKKTTKKKTTKKKTAKKKTTKKKTTKKKTTKKKTTKKKTTKKKTTKKKTAKKTTAKKTTAKKKTAKKKTTKKKTTKKTTAKKNSAPGETSAPSEESREQTWVRQALADSVEAPVAGTPVAEAPDTGRAPRLTEWPRTSPGTSGTLVGGGGPIAGERRPAENAAFDAAFESASVSVRAVGVRLRRLILGALPEAREAPFGGSKVRGLEFFARSRDPQPVVTLQPAEMSCLFTLQDGARLEDPHRVLAGSGSSLRHVKVFDFDNPPDSILLDLLEQGVKLAGVGHTFG